MAIKNEIRLFVEMFLVDKIKMDEDIDWIRFGRMGFEEGVLLIGWLTTSSHGDLILSLRYRLRWIVCQDIQKNGHSK